MFKKLLEKFGRKHLLKPGKAQKEKEVIDYGKFFTSVSSALVLLPEQLENFGIAINKQKELMEILPKTEFVYISKEKHLSLIPGDLKDRVLSISQAEINAFGVPNRKFIKKITQHHFDIIIDLNTDFDLLSTYISKKAAATLRICLCHPKRDPFYNLQVCASKEQSLDQQINILFDYLTKLITPQSPSHEALQPV